MLMKMAERVKNVLDLLEEEYPDADCALVHRNVYELLVCVTLSAQTTDISVNKITPYLFEKYPDAFSMAEANREDVADIIKTIGLYKTKSERIIQQAKVLVKDYDGNVPESDESLMKLPGVGRKTANVVMSVGFGHQRIAVDTHVFRVSNRIGIAKGDTVQKTEDSLKNHIPKKRLSKAHHLLIFHGRNCCYARNPKCEKCRIENYCKKTGLK